MAGQDMFQILLELHYTTVLVVLEEYMALQVAEVEAQV
jgi:hypothetical protein